MEQNNKTGRQLAGRRGERAAERHLRRAGLIVLARNWRGGGGEIDLALMERNTLVFAEVKTRTRARTDDRKPVSVAHRRRPAPAARSFRRRFGVTDLPVRFDLLEVDAGTHAVRWEKNYYRAQENR